jgi:serine/threonine protein kinase
MLHGQPPFYDSQKKKLMNNILYGDIDFRADLSEEARSLISSLMCRDPKKRPQFQEIVEHTFFSTLNLHEIQTMHTPITPL